MKHALRAAQLSLGLIVAMSAHAELAQPSVRAATFEQGSSLADVEDTAGRNTMELRMAPGDVVSTIPEPTTYLLTLAGLALVGFAGLRRKTR